MQAPAPQPEDTEAVDASTASPRFRWAVALGVFSCILAWPAVILIGLSAAWIGADKAMLLAGGCYALSWTTFGVAIWLGGSKVMGYSKRVLLRFVGQLEDGSSAHRS